MQLVVRGASGEITEANQAAADFYGRAREDLVGSTLQSLGDDSSGSLESTLEVATAIGVHLAGVPQRNVLGEMRLVEIYLSPLDGGEEPLVHLTVHDITERARAEERARALLAERVAQEIGARAAQEWQGTFDSIEQPILVVDSTGCVTRANEATASLLGVPVAALDGRRIESLGDHALWQAAAAHVQVAERYGSMGLARVRDTSGRTWEVSATRFVPPGDLSPRVIVVLRELTQLIALQGEIQRQETLSRMGELVGGVAHEVRNPLFALSSAIDALRHRMTGNADFARYAPHIDTQIERLSSLMRDLLDYGRPTALALRDTPVAELLMAALQLATPAAESAGVHLDASNRCPAGTTIRVDRHRMVVVLHNLLLNAVQHSQKGHAVEVQVSEERAGAETVVEIRVCDEGDGFSADTLDRVFEPFFTKRPGGTGLGLALAHRTVHDHGGTIVAENRLGTKGQVAGALLRIRLPTPVAPRLEQPVR